jgi:hypothetical protein
MNIVLHEMGTYTHVQQLAKALAYRGHKVSYVYCASVQTPSRSSIAFSPEDNVTVLAIELGSQFAKWQLVKRLYRRKPMESARHPRWLASVLI